MRKHENENKRKYKTKFSVGLFCLCLSFAFYSLISLCWCVCIFPLFRFSFGFSIFHSFNRHSLGIGSTLVYCWMLFFGSIILKRKCWKWEVHLHHHCDGWELWSRSLFFCSCWLFCVLALLWWWGWVYFRNFELSNYVVNVMGEKKEFFG